MAFRNLIPWQRERDIVRKEGEPSLISFQREMNRLFDDFFSGLDSSFLTPARASLFTPNINVKEDKDNLTVSAELPGMDEKDIEITMSENTVKISGEKKEETETDKGNYHYMERKSGYFTRVIELPVQVDSERAQAVFKKGVLEIKFPKQDKTDNVKRIEIQKE
ncbi:Hsp20/alpha crystallin family protein [candidate division WOR-3 bacterium]|nr:Hsp20/alpha crystallin family protein [candidate division WOR-3 bacterium]